MIIGLSKRDSSAPIAARQVEEGLYVVTDAYSGVYKFFEDASVEKSSREARDSSVDLTRSPNEANPNISNSVPPKR